MLRKMKDLKGFAIGAKDGDIGEASDFIFDDNNWTVRYLVADTERWLPGRRVLISPIVIDRSRLGRQKATGSAHPRASKEQSRHQSGRNLICAR